MASREKQLKRLKKDALQLWIDQQELIGRANGVARDAYPHAQFLAAERLVPAKALYEAKLKTSIDKGAVAGKLASAYVSSTARDAVIGTLVPAVSSAAAAALSLAEEASTRISGSAGAAAVKSRLASKPLDAITKKGHASGAKSNAKVKAALKAGRVASKAAAKSKGAGSDSGLGIGGVLGIVLGLLAVVGIGYAVWQTLRADDDLWVADDEPETTPNADGPTTA
jgi:hypothetical protein